MTDLSSLFLCVATVVLFSSSPFTSAQFLPFNFTNWTIPFPHSLVCADATNDNSTSTTSYALPSLSWCHSDNPYILSDFLSRNSTDLTTRSGGGVNDSFQLHIQCGGVPVEAGNTAFVNYSSTDSALATVYSSCEAIQAIDAGTAGTLNLNATVKNLTNYIVFADLNGQLLFVYFNNNTMSNNLKINVPNINNFATTNVQYIPSPSDNSTTTTTATTQDDDIIVQNMVLFVTNQTQAALLMVKGLDGALSLPCTIFNYDQYESSLVDLKLIAAEFYPRRANSTADIFSAAWVAALNYSKMLKYWDNASVPWWAPSVYYYEFNGVPTTQHTAVEFISVCPPKTPMGVQLYVTIFALSPVTFHTIHNIASNISLMLMHSAQGITINRVSYSGPNITNGNGIGTTIFKRNIPLFVDWCKNRTVFNPDKNVTESTPRAKNTIFCVPDDETVIDRVELTSPDTYSDIGVYTKDIWVIIALRNRTHSYLYVMSLTEFIFVPDTNSTFDNPLGLPDTYGTSAFPCHFDTQVYFYDNETRTYRCQVRVTATYAMPAYGNVTDLLARIIVPRSATTTGQQTTNNGGTNDNIGPGIMTDHALIFASQGDTVSVFAMYSGAVNDSNYFGLVFQPYNEVSFLGNVSNIYVSENGMHMLTAVDRHAWELESQTRYTEICERLAKDPHDPFLQSYAAGCASAPAQSVNINAFTQYASYCSFNMYCPSLDQLEVAMPPDRYYADRPAVSKICPKGYFCAAGQKIECPQGFYCDEDGLMAPKRCPLPFNSNSTCAQGGLVEPQMCPLGVICAIPHIPGLPVPPGFKTPAPPHLRTNFEECLSGEWCALGAQAPLVNSTIFTNTTFLCPGNTYCSDSSTIEPVPCECDDNAENATDSIITANGTVLHCEGRTLYCPAGSKDVELCPMGFYCTAPNVSVACIPTQFCAPGTFAPKLCTAGFYCPTPNVSIICPSGNYCPEGSVLPLSCNFLTVCPEGSASESRSLLTVFVLITVTAVVLIGFCLFNRYERHRRMQAAEVSLLSKEAREFITQGGLDEEDFLAEVVVGFSASNRGGVGSSVTSRRGGGNSGGNSAQNSVVKDNRQAAVNDAPPVLPQQQGGKAAGSSLLMGSQQQHGSSNNTQAYGSVGPTAKQQRSESDVSLPMLSSIAAADIGIPTSRFQTPALRFEGMGLRLEVGEAKGKVVLDNVTGTIPPGSFVAVMGPSGSGKSTFMHTLAGKAFYGTRLGKVYVNEDEVDLNRFSKIVGFVKQDDIMLREMTVFETMLFNAQARYDPLGTERPEAITNAMVAALDLNHVRDINIGDEKKRGISGGQRKRVNIGMEMVALPAILFLDEPTSGLDSSSSMSVCGSLRDMASVGVTVIAVIHQPRYEIFNMFHKVLLLAKGGKLVYYGAPEDALRYFEDYIGIKCPPHVNPPDFFMDVISGEVNEAGLSIDDMVLKWQEFHAAQAEEGSGVSSRPASSTRLSINAPPSLVPGLKLAEQAKKKEIAGFWKQLQLFTKRSFVQLSRDLVWFFTDLMLVFVSGFFLGLVFSTSVYQPPLPEQIVNRSMSAFGNSPPPMLSEFFARPVDDPIISIASLTCMAVGMTGVTAALRVFGNEQIVYWREASAGMSTTAYFLAKNLTHLLFIFISPMMYLAPFRTFVATRASILAYYRVLVLIQFATTGLGYLISIVVPGALAQLGGVVAVLVFAMFGGSRPTLVEIKQMFVLLQAMPYASYIRWGQEALYLEEITMWNDIQGVNINPSLALFDYHLDDYKHCMMLTFVFGVFFRVLALVGMHALNRDQKR
ncbi:ABC transporter, putative [Bodo saltans]|uniref:ABC transporter, putative n=1 Tax=Bodo saltans TaxID=75058 RepID=A0A0S4JGH5_BODSA|nr:ABC transporter, putative [Bodo saltans]|eukprot:CUG89279.1 ABC transporter, putative [Bodo saltans]